MNWECPDSVTFAYGNVRMWELIQRSHGGCESCCVSFTAAGAKHMGRREGVTEDM